MKERILRQTADGSHTIAVPHMQVTYHSKHGAIQESRHVFIQAGWQYVIDQSQQQAIAILEMGFGTGLNALLTLQQAAEHNRAVYYQSLELYPLPVEQALQLNYGDSLHMQQELQQLHEAAWNEDVHINDHFVLHKSNVSLLDFIANRSFDLIYYDAFAPAAQPELWTPSVFEKLFALLNPNSILVTYCSKSDVRRAMIAAGFIVEKIPGPMGKREMLRAMKVL